MWLKLSTRSSPVLNRKQKQKRAPQLRCCAVIMSILVRSSHRNSINGALSVGLNKLSGSKLVPSFVPIGTKPRKNPKHLASGLSWCGQQDLNLHEKLLIRSLVLCVCQFRHDRIFYKIGSKRTCLNRYCSHIITNLNVLVNNFYPIY